MEWESASSAQSIMTAACKSAFFSIAHVHNLTTRRRTPQQPADRRNRTDTAHAGIC